MFGSFPSGRFARRFFRLAGAVSAPLWLGSALPALTVDFGDVNLATPPAQSGFGGVYYNGSDLAGGWSSGGVSFPNSHTDFGGGFYTWDGFAYSTTTDTATAGYLNQYSAYAPSGPGAYAVAYPAATLAFAGPVAPQSVRLANTTYAALDMLAGSAFSKKFGGDSGNDADWFKVVLTGLDASGAFTGSLEFYLADFRFLDNAFDYVVSDWTTFDLTGLGGNVSFLELGFFSSDVGSFGINTPTYVALDDLVFTPVPEPASAATLAGGLLLVVAAARRRGLRTPRA